MTKIVYASRFPSSTTSNNVQYNVAVGTTALDAVTTGVKTVAIGYDALTANTTGNQNTVMALGYQSLKANTTGSFNLSWVENG